MLRESMQKQCEELFPATTVAPKPHECVCDCGRTEENFAKVLTELKSQKALNNFDDVVSDLLTAIESEKNVVFDQKDFLTESFCLATFPPSPPAKKTCRELWPCRQPELADCEYFHPNRCNMKHLKNQLNIARSTNEAKEYLLIFTTNENRMLKRQLHGLESNECLSKYSMYEKLMTCVLK